GRRARAPRPGAARAPAGPPPPPAGDARARGDPVLGGRVSTALGSPRLRPRLGRAARSRPSRGRAAVRIAILSPVWYPVPPDIYGGIEWVVSMLADGLAGLGHDVTLFASGDSRTTAKLSSVYERAPSELFGHGFPELRHALACYEQADRFDIVNDHSGPIAAAVGGCLGVPVLHTVHLPVEGELGEVYAQVAAIHP